jgi:hypothetical protein
LFTGVDLDDIRSRMLDGDLHPHRCIGIDVARFDLLAIAAHGDAGGGWTDPLILDAKSDGLRLADNAKARRGGQYNSSIALIGDAGDQRMQWRREAERRSIGRHVMHAAVGDHECAGNAIRRHVGKGCTKGVEQSRAVGFAIGHAGFDHAHIEIGNAGQPLGQRGARLLGLPRTLAKALARTLVDHNGNNGGNGIAVFAGERRVRQGEDQQRESGRAHQCAAAADEQQHRRCKQRNDRRRP